MSSSFSYFVFNQHNDQYVYCVCLMSCFFSK
uniref:Uncharacterized protein n=1 Tax=Anguilla anguilla TaxID=7936 RepID=A0A0E9PTP5_ANGAN